MVMESITLIMPLPGVLSVTVCLRQFARSQRGCEAGWAFTALTVTLSKSVRPRAAITTR